MSAEIIHLPTVRITRMDGRTVTRSITLDYELDCELRAAAKLAGCDPEGMAEALVLYGLETLKMKPIEVFHVQSNVETIKEKAASVLPETSR